jgi:hypothetical protein
MAEQLHVGVAHMFHVPELLNLHRSDSASA